MGVSPSKRVKSSFSNSPEFNSACDSAFSHCLSLTEHGFDGVFPFQLATASDHLYQTLQAGPHPHPLILRWVPSPPTRSQVDSALRAVPRESKATTTTTTLGPAQFKQWAVELFAGAVVCNARQALMVRVPIGVAGIAGLGAASRSGKDIVGTAIGVYALGVATAIYLGLQ
ncbi:hypothetical protein RchiOBHm_Chr2g0138101 [Rosa chinensis]|uniref:Transmembrane protein n=1 Tax=Rosa chinensis TaxID=74649 RepID=A0A2P6RWU0_ROSCH|nr:uncharacterized protein LOC112187708 [Rosa chinensis]PRQ50881.1 hypothetical protein RchiOBHm_Chr2g0138101 [Rosa chinensis]